MALQVIYDLVAGTEDRYRVEGRQLVRACLVTGIDTACNNPFGLGPTEIARQAIGIPLFTPHPGVPYVTLTEYQFRSIPSATDSIYVDLIYTATVTNTGGVNGVVWGIEDWSTANYVPSYASADNSDSTWGWYLPGSTASTKPAGAQPFGVALQRPITQGGLRVTGAILGADWNTYRPQVEALEARLNSSAWRGYTRGTVLFLGKTTKTTDRGRSYILELNFAKDPTGQFFFPYAPYIDPTLDGPPADIDMAGLFAAGLPAQGQVIRRNGIIRGSVALEGDFNSVFTF